jgi:hypothetical protein
MTEWTDPLVQRLIRRHRGRDPREIIQGFAEECLLETEQRSLAINVELIASMRGIRRRVDDYPFAGRIYAEPSGQLVMDLRADDIEVRRRFTCAHEIIHTAFPGFVKETRYRVDTTVGVNTAKREEEEYLCDYGAAELLMPRKLLVDRYSVTGGLRNVKQLADDARVSIEAAANRLISLADTPSALLVFRWGHKPADLPRLRRGEEVPECLRLRYATVSHLNMFLPKYKSAEEGSVFVRALETPRIVRGLGRLPGGPQKDFEIEAKEYPWGDDRRVIAIARPVA